MRKVTLIGSRSTSPTNLKRLQTVADLLVRFNYVLRSGGANGADSIVTNTKCNKELFIPWDGFNNLYHNPKTGIFNAKLFKNHRKAIDIAKSIHASPERLTPGSLYLHARNVYQVMGASLKDYSRLVVYSAPETKDHKVQGGTATAVHLARLLKIPTVNVSKDKEYKALIDKLLEFNKRRESHNG